MKMNLTPFIVAINKAFAGWVFSGAGKVGIGGMAGLLDKAKEAMDAEAAACAGSN